APRTAAGTLPSVACARAPAGVASSRRAGGGRNRSCARSAEGAAHAAVSVPSRTTPGRPVSPPRLLVCSSLIPPPPAG
ncbi:MAG: hypothetical protein ACK56I_12005, partial [bacterium]